MSAHHRAKSPLTISEMCNVATGKVLGEHKKRRRRVEFLGFMDKVVAAFPDRELHVVLDNLNTHKKNERWLKKHPRVHFHFTPTRASWLNQIETWFSILQGQSLSGASFTAVSQLQELCLHQCLERKGRALFLDQEKGPPTPLQRQAYHPALIPGTRPVRVACGHENESTTAPESAQGILQNKIAPTRSP
jgi:transposase